MSLFYVAIPVGSALGYALGALMLWLINWRWAFYFDLPIGVLLGLCCFLMPEPRRGQADADSGESMPSESPPPLRSVAVLFQTPSYVLNILGMTAMTFALGGIGYWLPAFIYEDRYDRTIALTTVSGLFGIIMVVAGLTATLLGGWVGDKLQPRHPGSYFLVSGVSMIVGCACFLAFLVTPFPWAWGLVFAGVFGLFFSTGPTNTVLANVVHPSLRATGYAVNIFLIHAFGDAISPPIIGAIADRTNLTIGFLTMSILLLASGLFWLWGARFLERDTALAITRSGNPTRRPTGTKSPDSETSTWSR